MNNRIFKTSTGRHIDLDSILEVSPVHESPYNGDAGAYVFTITYILRDDVSYLGGYREKEDCQRIHDEVVNAWKARKS